MNTSFSGYSEPAMQINDGPMVDCHFHLYQVRSPLTAEAWHQPPEDAEPGQFLDLMDQHGVLFGVIAAASLHGTYNDYVRAALLGSKRFRATAIVDPSIDIYQLEKMKADGFVGIRFVWRDLPNPPDIDSAAYKLLLRRVADLGWHVHVYEHPQKLEKLIAAIEGAGAKVVVDHMANPFPADGVNDPGFKATLAAIERGRTWVKLSGGFRQASPAAAAACAAELLKVSGGERLVWGSDWPFAGYEGKIAYAQTIAALHEWVPNPETRRLITCRTPLELYFT